MNLEDELGTKLFIREARGVTPTERGTMLMRETEDLVARLDAVAFQIKSHNRVIGGTVRLGVLFGHMGAMSRLNTAAVYACRDAYPDIELITRNASPSAIEDAVEKGALDFGFSAFPSRPQRFSCHKLFEFKWFMIMGHDHPLADSPYLEVSDLAGQKLIFPKDEQYDRLQLVRALPDRMQPRFVDAEGTLFDVVFEQILPMKAMMLCAEPHAPLFNPAIVRSVPLRTDLLRSQIYLLYRKGAVLSDAARQVLSFLLNAWSFPDALSRFSDPASL